MLIDHFCFKSTSCQSKLNSLCSSQELATKQYKNLIRVQPVMCSKASQSALSLASAADREEAEEIAKKNNNKKKNHLLGKVERPLNQNKNKHENVCVGRKGYTAG